MRISVGGSKDRMIRISAKFADGINVGSGMKRSSDIISKITPELSKYNKTLDDYLISGFGTVTLAQNDVEYESLATDLAQRTNKSVVEIKEDGLIGTPEILIDKFKTLKKLGMKLFIMSIQPATNLDEMLNKYDLFEQKVRPYLQ